MSIHIGLSETKRNIQKNIFERRLSRADKIVDIPDIKTEEYDAVDFFDRRAALSFSGQPEGEVAAMAFGKIYTFGPSFRVEKSNTPRHVAEFWHVEPEVAFAELPDIIKRVVKAISP